VAGQEEDADPARHLQVAPHDLEAIEHLQPGRTQTGDTHLVGEALGGNGIHRCAHLFRLHENAGNSPKHSGRSVHRLAMRFPPRPFTAGRL